MAEGKAFFKIKVTQRSEKAFETLAQTVGINVKKIGTVGGNKLTCNDISKEVSAIKERYFNRFAEVIEQDI